MKIDAAVKSDLRKKIMRELKSPQNRIVTVRSAYPMSNAELTKLQKTLPEMQSAHLINEVDPEIIAGMIIIDGSKIIDFSIKGRLNELVSSLLAH